MTIDGSIGISDHVEWLTDPQADQIVQVLHQFGDAVALALLVDANQSCTNISELLHKLEKLLPEAIQPAFYKQTTWLQIKAVEDPAFIQRIKQEFTVYVGPITPLLVDMLLKNNANFSQFDLIEALLGYLAPEANIRTARQQLCNATKQETLEVL